MTAQMNATERQEVIDMIDRLPLESPEQVADYALSEPTVESAKAEVRRAAQHDGIVVDEVAR